MNNSTDPKSLNEVIDKAEHLTRYGTMLLAMVGENQSAKDFVVSRWQENMATNADVLRLDARNIESLADLLSHLNQGFGFDLEEGESLSSGAIEQFSVAVQLRASDSVKVCAIEHADVLPIEATEFLVALTQRMVSFEQPLRFFLSGDMQLEANILLKTEEGEEASHILSCPNVDAEVPLTEHDFQDSGEDDQQVVETSVGDVFDASEETYMQEEEEADYMDPSASFEMDDVADTFESEFDGSDTAEQESEDDILSNIIDSENIYNKPQIEKKKWPAWLRLAFGFGIVNVAVLAVAVVVYFQGGDFLHQIEDELLSVGDKPTVQSKNDKALSKNSDSNAARKEGTTKQMTAAPTENIEVIEQPAVKEVVLDGYHNQVDEVIEPELVQNSSPEKAKEQKDLAQQVADKSPAPNLSESKDLAVNAPEPGYFDKAPTQSKKEEMPVQKEMVELSKKATSESSVDDVDATDEPFKVSKITEEEKKKLAIVKPKTVPKVTIEEPVKTVVSKEKSKAPEVSKVEKFQTLEKKKPDPLKKMAEQKQNDQFTKLEKKLLDKNGQHYALQLISLSNELKIKQLINKHNLSDKGLYYRGRLKGKEAFFLIYGEYKTLKEAAWAMEHWPESKGDFNPFVKRISWAKRQLKEAVH